MLRRMIAIALVVAAVAAGTHTIVARQAGSQTATPASGPVVNLNTATQAELEKLPGVGPATAKQILEYRQKNGGFKKVEELMNIKGIGEKSFLKLKPLVTVAPPKVVER